MSRYMIISNEYFHGGFELPEWMRRPEKIKESLDYNDGHSCRNCIYRGPLIQCPEWSIGHYLKGEFLFCDKHETERELVKHGSLTKEDIENVNWLVEKIKKDKPKFIDGYIMDYFPEAVPSNEFFEEVYKKLGNW